MNLPPATLPDPKRILVPRQHGQILIEPNLQTLAATLNTRAHATPRQFAGLPWEEITRSARSDLAQTITQHAAAIGISVPSIDPQAPWVITGHQVEFYHAGVWAKVVAADTLARQTGAVPIDLLVDHDQLDHFGFDLPVQKTSPSITWHRERLSWPPHLVPNHALDAIPAPDLASFESWDSTLANNPFAQSDALAIILSALRPRQPEPYSLWMSRARHRLESTLGIQVHHVTTSALCSSNAWHLFVLEWIRHAATWADCYNRQLAAYRHRAGIHNPSQPMPDLHRDPTTQELPFWIYRPGEPRERLLLQHGTTLHHGTTEIPLDSALTAPGWSAAENLEQLLATQQLVIRPRALTLTMYTRLFLSDLFIHGIGGALYDQITDAIMQELFNVTPPYACVSAAWFLPLSTAPTLPVTAPNHSKNRSEENSGGDEPETPSSLAHLRHHLQHNPERALDPFTARQPATANLLNQRATLINQISHSLKSQPATERPQRRQWFDELHQLNATLHTQHPAALKKLDQAIVQAKQDQENLKVLHWREFYFALHTTESLTRFIKAIRETRN